MITRKEYILNNELGLYEFLVKANEIIKISKYLKIADIKPQNFSSYIRYRNLGAISNEKLNYLYYLINLDLSSLLDRVNVDII